MPAPQELPERLQAVLQVVYLVFNEGYSAAAGAEVTRAELTGEAIRLGRLLTELQPEPEVIGLLALMLLQESRRAARTSPSGELILLENQPHHRLFLSSQSFGSQSSTLLPSGSMTQRNAPFS